MATAAARDDVRVNRILYRQRILPEQLVRARARVAQLEKEAVSLGIVNVEELRQAALAGDMIAREWLRRLDIPA